LSKHTSVIDLDIHELSGLLLTQGSPGEDAIVSIIDESLSALGPIANVVVQSAMTFEDRTDEYELPRNYSGSILRNKLIADKAKRLGVQIMSERGLISDEGGFTNPIIKPILQVLTNPNRVIHNFTMLAEYQRAEFVKQLSVRMGSEAAERSVPETPPNGFSYPVTAYTASIIATEHGSVVIAPNDFNSMLFDLQLVAPGSVAGFVSELVKVANDITPPKAPKTAVYGIKIPGGTEVNAAIFADASGRWTAAFEEPTQGVEYTPLLDEDGGQVDGGYVVAVNSIDLLDARANKESVAFSNIEEAAKYIAKLSDVPLAKREGFEQPLDDPEV
jgi:predicted RNase H-like HicB family nuclease